MDEPLDDERKNKLTNCMVKLIENLNVSNEIFWAKLEESQVISSFQREEIHSGNKTNGEKRYQLVTFVMKGSIDHYNKFLEALLDTGQTALAHKVDEEFCVSWHLAEKEKDPNHVEPVLRTQLKSQAVPIDLADEDLSVLKNHYQTRLQRSFVHEMADRSEWFLLNHVFSQVVITGKDLSNATKSSKFIDDASFRIEDFFDYNDVVSTLVEGDPGTGKTTLLKHFAWLWSTEEPTNDDVGEDLVRDKAMRMSINSIRLMKKFKLLIFIDSNSEGVTLDRTMYNALKGSDAQKSDAMKFAKRCPQLTLVVVDGLDEFANNDVRREILDLIESRCTHILLSVRTNHPVIENKTSLFDRLMKTAGFNMKESPIFIENFMKTIGKEEGESKKLRDLVERNLLELGHFLTTPLNCTLMCLLYSEGEIKEEDFEGITLVDLLKKQERYLLNRESLKRSRRDHRDWKQVLDEDLRKIYRMAFVSLLRDTGKYTLDQVRSFGINTDSPALVILRKIHTVSIQDGQRYLMGWWHEAHREFDAAQFLQDNPEVHYLAAGNPELNQVTFFLTSIIAKSDIDKAARVLHTAMFLQGPKPPCRYKVQKMLRSHGKCKEVNRARHIVRDNTREDICAMVEKGEETERFSFENCTDVIRCMQKSGWLIENTVALSIVGQSLTMCHNMELRVKLAKKVLFPFLPTESYGSDSKHHRYIAVPDAPELMCISRKGQFLSIWVCNISSLVRVSSERYLDHLKGIKAVVVDVGTHLTALGFPFCRREHSGQWVNAIQTIQQLYNPDVLSLMYPRIPGGSTLFWSLKKQRSVFTVQELNMTWIDENGQSLTRNIM